MSKWAERFLGLCDYISGWSKDPSTQLGCVIVDGKNRIVSIGFNGFPVGVDDKDERYNDRPTKYKYVAHAERNALDLARTSVEGCVLYVGLLPCNECAKSIIQCGIKKVITRTPNRPDVYNWDITKQMFTEAGVDLVFLDD